MLSVPFGEHLDTTNRMFGEENGFDNRGRKRVTLYIPQSLVVQGSLHSNTRVATKVQGWQL